MILYQAFSLVFSENSNSLLPNPTALPISVPIEAIKLSGDMKYEYEECPKETITDTACGMRWWYTSNYHSAKSSFEYTFKGERFQVYAKWDSTHGTFDVYLDDVKITTIDQFKYANQTNALQYTSDIIPYG